MQVNRTRPRRQSKRTNGSRIHTDSDDEQKGDVLEELTRPQLLEINQVFDSIAARSRGSFNPPTQLTSLKKDSASIQLGESSRSVEHHHHPGGFIVDDQEASVGGGFMTEDDSTDQTFEGGGFITEDAEASHVETAPTGPSEDHGRRTSMYTDRNQSSTSSDEAPNYIELAQVPEALKMLGLPYKNSEILEIFQNAGSSDEDESWPQNRSTQAKCGKQKSISRIKFSKVCAVLMMMANEASDTPLQQAPELIPKQQKGDRTKRRKMIDSYDLSSDDSCDQSSSASDFQPEHPAQSSSRPGPSRRQRRKPPRSCSPAGSDESEAESSAPSLFKEPLRPTQRGRTKHGITKRVGAPPVESSSSLETFALFFQSRTSSSTAFDPRQVTIGFEEVRKAANELGEKLSDEDIHEMLNYASGTEFPFVTYEAFEKLLRDISSV